MIDTFSTSSYSLHSHDISRARIRTWAPSPILASPLVDTSVPVMVAYQTIPVVYCFHSALGSSIGLPLIVVVLLNLIGSLCFFAIWFGLFIGFMAIRRVAGPHIRPQWSIYTTIAVKSLLTRYNHL